MKFRLTSVRESDGKELVHVYDNVRNRIETEEGTPICLEYDPRIEMMLSTISYDESEKVSNHKKAHVVDEMVLSSEDVEKCLNERLNLIVTYGSSKSMSDMMFYGRALRLMRRFLRRNREEDLGLTLRIRLRVTPITCRLRKLPHRIQFHLGSEKPIEVEVEGIVVYDVASAARVNEFDLQAITKMMFAVKNLDVMETPKEVTGVRGAVDVVFRRLSAERDVFRVAELEAMQGKNKINGSVIEHLQKPKGSRCVCLSCPFLISCLGGDPTLSDESHVVACGTLRYWHMALFSAAWFRIFESTLQTIEPIEEW